MRLITDRAPSGSDPATDVAIAQALLRQAGRGEIGPTLRIAGPLCRAVAFGRMDVRRPGFASAAGHCRDAGFEPLVRSVGGRAAAYTEQTLVIDHVVPEREPGRRLHQRFEEYGELISVVLADLGVDARVGEVPGEFCPGTYSINARGVAKLVGTAQRVVRDAWLFSSVIVIDGADEIRALLPPVYEYLGLAFYPVSVGAVAEEAPGVDAEVLSNAFVKAYAQMTDLEPVDLDEGTLAQASGLLREHTVR
ncbi:MAG: lipoate--protein ligase family protein [Nocardioidaceae bacterium]